MPLSTLASDRSLGKATLLSFLPGVLLLTLFLFWGMTWWGASTERHLMNEASAAIGKGAAVVAADLRLISASMLALAESDALRRLASDEHADTRAPVARDFLAYSNRMKVFDQVRYLDGRGREIVRVDRVPGQSRLVPDTRLQDKSDRYYYRASMPLAPGSVYLSRFDLNEEHGRVEEPHKPVIRFATPVADPSGRTRGVLVLNYLGEDLIANLRQSLAGTSGQLLLLNTDGYWLVAQTPELEWGFQLSGRGRFSDAHPELWAAMQAAGRDAVRADDGIYAFTTIHPLVEIEAGLADGAGSSAVGPAGETGRAQAWTAVSFIPAERLAALADERLRTGLTLFAAAVALWAILSLIIARLRINTLRSRALAERLRGLVEQTRDLVFITDRHGRIEYVNPSFEHVTGFSRAEALGQPASILASGEHSAEFYKELWATLERGEVFQGVLTNRTRDGALFYEQKTITPIRDQRNRITHFASTGTDITDQVRTQDRLFHLAYHNPLTELPNRALFRDRLVSAITRSQRSGQMVALMFLDLDHFKNVNDTLGHAAGDLLLKQVAHRLLECVRESDTVAHIGGDEFAIILDDIASDGAAISVAEKIRELFNQNFGLDHRQVFVGMSIGIALYPLDDTDIDDLIKDADTALYHAKAQGRHRYEFYTPELTRRITERVTIEADLRQGLEEGQFEVRYQPVVDLSSGAIQSTEALLRWRHPTRGLVYPEEFIGILEDSGLIVPVTRWLLADACLANRSLRRETGRDISLAINFSARSFLGHQEALEPVLEMIGKGLIKPDHLVIEITESVLLENTGTVLPTLRHLRELGVRIAIDDFGTGYSSLTYLRQFPIDIVKIDREFIRHLPDSADDRALVTGIIAIAHGLGIKVVAEGVETREQRDYLRALGCDSVQGFLFSRAVALKDSIAVVRNSPPFRPWPNGREKLHASG